MGDVFGWRIRSGTLAGLLHVEVDIDTGQILGRLKKGSTGRCRVGWAEMTAPLAA